MERHAILVIGLGYGDCGKGSIVDFLTRRCEAGLVVRFNGGPQAAHNVVTADGRHHTFAQFGSGSFVTGVKTLLSRFMLIEPYALFNEAAHLSEIGVGDALERLLIDERCLVITPAHQAANRLRELARGTQAHGTCGVGVGEAMADLHERPGLMLHARDLTDRGKVVAQLQAIRDLKIEQLRNEIAALRDHPRARFGIDTLLDASWIETAVDRYSALAQKATVLDPDRARAALRAPDAVIFEGAQGVLLDESYGFHPHTTWSTTTFANAFALLDEARYDGARTRIGVLRTYLTRHGPGPLVTENTELAARLPEPHNGNDGWQGSFRVGVFDAIAARYAIGASGGLDVLAITQVDKVPLLPAHICTAYEAEPAQHADQAMRGVVTDIPVSTRPDLLHQTRLGEALKACRPIYSPLREFTRDALLRRIEDELGAPVAIESSGPAAGHKLMTGRLPR